MNKTTGIKRLINAWRYSFSGLKMCWQKEASFRQEMLLVVVLIPAAFYLTDIAHERALLIAPLMLILIIEVINSAIEASVDLFSSQPHALAKQAKDMGSAAVWLSFVLAVLIWLIVLV